MSSLKDEIADAIDTWWMTTNEPTLWHDGEELIASLDIAEVLMPIVKKAQAQALEDWAKNVTTLVSKRQDLEFIQGLRLAAGNAVWHAKQIRDKEDN